MKTSKQNREHLRCDGAVSCGQTMLWWTGARVSALFWAMWGPVALRSLSYSFPVSQGFTPCKLCFLLSLPASFWLL